MYIKVIICTFVYYFLSNYIESQAYVEFWRNYSVEQLANESTRIKCNVLWVGGSGWECVSE